MIWKEKQPINPVQVSGKHKDTNINLIVCIILTFSKTQMKLNKKNLLYFEEQTFDTQIQERKNSHFFFHENITIKLI